MTPLEWAALVLMFALPLTAFICAISDWADE